MQAKQIHAYFYGEKWESDLWYSIAFCDKNLENPETKDIEYTTIGKIQQNTLSWFNRMLRRWIKTMSEHVIQEITLVLSPGSIPGVTALNGQFTEYGINIYIILEQDIMEVHRNPYDKLKTVAMWQTRASLMDHGCPTDYSAWLVNNNPYRKPAEKPEKVFHIISAVKQTYDITVNAYATKKEARFAMETEYKQHTAGISKDAATYQNKDHARIYNLITMETIFWWIREIEQQSGFLLFKTDDMDCNIMCRIFDTEAEALQAMDADIHDTEKIYYANDSDIYTDDPAPEIKRYEKSAAIYNAASGNTTWWSVQKMPEIQKGATT